MFSSKKCLYGLLAITTLTACEAGAATLYSYISPPGAMSSAVTGVTTETFNNPALSSSHATTYQSAIGDYAVPAGYVLPVVLALVGLRRRGRQAGA